MREELGLGAALAVGVQAEVLEAAAARRRRGWEEPRLRQPALDGLQTTPHPFHTLPNERGEWYWDRWSPALAWQVVVLSLHGAAAAQPVLRVHALRTG